MATNPSTLPENSGRITAPDANYPYGSAKNDSTGTTGDGTPIRKPLMDDTYGFYQALLLRTGQVPSGNAETAIASQLADAVAILGGQALRVNVASAAAVDLTASAPNTSHVNITGTDSISAFTVAAGRLIFVRFGGAATLVNGAALVTQTGANIVANVGDTCILRATAANTVEVLCYSSVVLNSDSGWLTPTLQNSYTMDGANPIRYRKIGKTVYVTGAVRRANAISGLQTIFTLPVGFRPSKASQVGSPIWVYDNLAAQLCGAGIGTDGGLNTGFVITLAGTPSGAGGFSINASFVVD